MPITEGYNYYYVTSIILMGTAEITLQFPASTERIDITTGADAIAFELILKNVMREPFIKMGANSFYSIDVKADLIKIKGQLATAATEVQVVGWYTL